MKIASFKSAAGSSYGIVVDDGIISASESFRQRFATVRDVLEADALAELAKDVRHGKIDLQMSAIEWLPPVTNSQRVFCIGINYPKRYPLDNPAPPPEHIILFAKLDGTLVGHNQYLEIPSGEAAHSFDYEGEIALVVGKAGRHIAKADALDHIAGYTIVNDGSVRDWQKHSLHAGKNFANSSSCGPWMVTADEITEPDSMRLTTSLNGGQVQNTTAAQMIFSIAEIIAYISHTIDLRPGDIIATGSPEGAGGSRQPPRFLREGDELDFEVSGVGVLHNRVG